MGFTEGLTLIFITMKLLRIISWNWFFVLLPEIIAVAIYVIVGIVTAIKAHRINKKIDKSFNDMW